MKTSNEYAQLIEPALFEKMPKTVVAALAVSFALRLSDDAMSGINELLRREWATLHKNGIVPQKPCARKPLTITAQVASLAPVAEVEAAITRGDKFTHLV